MIAETVNRADPFEARVAIALSMEKMAPLLPDSLISPVFNFLVVKEALGDRHSQVRRAMLNAGIAIIDLHGGKTVAGLMQMFEDYLGKKGPSSETTDFIKEAVVIVRSKRDTANLSFSVVSLVTWTSLTLAFLKWWIA